MKNSCISYLLIILSICSSLVLAQDKEPDKLSQEEWQSLMNRVRSYDSTASEELMDVVDSGRYPSGASKAEMAAELASVLKIAAGMGEKRAQNRLAECYRQGIGVRQNSKLAKTWERVYTESPDIRSILMGLNDFSENADNFSSGLSAQSARKFVEKLSKTYGSNDLTYAKSLYAPVVTEMKSGQQMSIDEVLKSVRALIQRWPERVCWIHDYAWRGNRVEIRMRYSCSNTKDKIVSGFCKATWIISSSGQIIEIADDTNKNNMPEFSQYVGTPIPWKE